jgi:hypothetical protein
VFLLGPAPGFIALKHFWVLGFFGDRRRLSDGCLSFRGLFCSATKLSLMGVTWRSYATARTGLRTVADRCRYKAHYIGQRGLGPHYRVARSPRDGQSASVFTIRVSGEQDLSWRTPPLLGRTYPMSEWSWQLCVFSW